LRALKVTCCVIFDELMVMDPEAGETMYPTGEDIANVYTPLGTLKLIKLEEKLWLSELRVTLHKVLAGKPEAANDTEKVCPLTKEPNA